MKLSLSEGGSKVKIFDFSCSILFYHPNYILYHRKNEFILIYIFLIFFRDSILNPIFLFSLRFGHLWLVLLFSTVPLLVNLMFHQNLKLFLAHKIWKRCFGILRSTWFLIQVGVLYTRVGCNAFFLTNSTKLSFYWVICTLKRCFFFWNFKTNLRPGI